MRLVKWLLGLAVVATLAWGGLWIYGALKVKEALDQVLKAPNAPLTARAHVVQGLPNRMDVRLTDPVLDLDNLRWTAPFIEFFSLIYRPHHVIMVVANEQSLTLNGQTLALSTEDLRASVVMRPTGNLVLDRAVLVARMPVLTLPGERLSADTARAAIRLAEGETRRYEAVIEIEAGFPDQAVMAAIDPDGLLPRRWDLLRLDGEITLERPLDLEVFRGAPMPPAALALTGAQAEFDGIRLDATGRITPDAQGFPEGELVVSVTNWAALSARLVEAGLVPAAALTWVQAAGSRLARTDAPEVLDIPLRLTGGQLRLGPLVLAELPAL